VALVLLRCSSDRGADLPTEYLDVSLGLTKDTSFPLTIGREYVVFALTTFVGGIWYYIADDDYSYYPVWSPAPLFAVVDGAISPAWRAAHHRFGERMTVVLAFDEWAHDPSYYERLTEHDEGAVATFRMYKERLEAEHPPKPS
jgi:hypothetical protein